MLWSRFGPYHHARLRGLREAVDASVSVIGLEVASSDEYAWVYDVGADSVKPVTMCPGDSYEEVSAHRVALATYRHLSALKPTVVVVNGWGTAEAVSAIAWCRWTGVPCVVMSETKSDDVPGQRAGWKEYLKGVMVRNCDAALVGGNKQAEYLVNLGFPSERIFLGYDTVDNSFFESRSRLAIEESEAMTAEYGLPTHYFFTCTRFLRRKNVDGLLRAYSAYRNRCKSSPWGLVIAGSGEEENSVRELERSLGVAGVKWVGFVRYDVLPVYYGLASALIHPAKQEAWGLVVNEAAACHLPLLVGDKVGARYELLRDGGNGILFEASSDDDICRAMCEFSALPAEVRAKMGQISHEIVSHWSPKRFGEQLLAASKVARAARIRAATRHRIRSTFR